MRTALLVSTYNWPEALNLVFKSIEHQSVFPDEILIADDGSTNKTKSVIDDFKNRYSVTVKHFWHEDNGFRKSEILNKAIANTAVDYIVQIDGDCIMHHHFIEDHIQMAEDKVFIFGSRVNIGKKIKNKVLEGEKIDFSFFSSGIKKRGRTFRFPLLRNRYQAKPEFSSKVRGCNLSFWRKDFLKVNGYNEDISGWGREDSELILRMLNSGVMGRRLKFGGIIYHIFHPEASKDNLEINNKIQQSTIKDNKISCDNGVNKYLK
ncbi:glycosyltransferase family 2 protein [Christiangramia sediminis]|uniref:Glycosyltransferase family 2 protein n=1 Tax=Christiangramia sediminis TaxID=2881336 RepID=A0A9X1LIB0_9FLAO|nr:glycosyltransferase family 2 protein [Christiangramia sediminis]MCB7480848.1 glycosyltransferase family 2 protein [Christiangramia sediminis]